MTISSLLYEVDQELKTIANSVGINLDGYKHVIETTGTSHSQNRHGELSKDRMPLSLEDYLLIPYISVGMKWKSPIIVRGVIITKHSSIAKQLENNMCM